MGPSLPLKASGRSSSQIADKMAGPRGSGDVRTVRLHYIPNTSPIIILTGDDDTFR